MRFNRALALACYNWPLYLFCLVTAAIGFAAAAITALPEALRIAGFFGGAVASWFAVSSFTAFHWMFDRSGFLSGQWLTNCIDREPNTCVQLSVCVEETTLPISQVFPQTDCTNLDLFDDSLTTEPAIARAKLAVRDTNSLPAKPDALPLDNDLSDLTVVTLAAHEVRDPAQRESLFREVSRITSPSGRVVIAEHLRNASAALAFGPGLFHFYPRSEWTTLARNTGFEIESEFDITPFFHMFVLRHA